MLSATESGESPQCSRAFKTTEESYLAHVVETFTFQTYELVKSKKQVGQSDVSAELNRTKNWWQTKRRRTGRISFDLECGSKTLQRLFNSEASFQLCTNVKFSARNLFCWSPLPRIEVWFKLVGGCVTCVDNRKRSLVSTLHCTRPVWNPCLQTSGNTLNLSQALLGLC